MAIPAWFDEYVYLNSKLNQLTSSGETGYTTINQVKTAILNAGFTSTYEHFAAYSLAERTSPNEYFNTNEYLAAKAEQMGGTWTADKVALAFQNAGYANAYDHFVAWGWQEGVNPSNSFDISSYLESKAAESGLTVAEVTDAFAAAGLDPISHYLLYGQNEAGVTVSEVPSDEQVAPDTTSGSAGQTFTLTNSVQNLVGTNGNDIFIAGDQGGTATLNAGDQLDGASGTDVLKIYNATSAINTANFANAVIANIENVEATMSATTQVLNVSGNANVTKVSLVNGFDGVVTLKAAQTAGLSGGITTTAAATFAFSDVTGGADSVNLALSSADLTTNGVVKGVTIAGVETLNISATGTNLLGATLLADATKVVITGTGSVSSTLTGTKAKTIDGSAATGNLTIVNTAAAAAIETINTGTGNDTYSTVFANLTLDDTINLGTGTDSLRFSDATSILNATDKGKFAKVSGVEQLGTLDKTLTVDGDFVTQNAFYTNGAAGKMVLTNVANDATVTFGETDVIANATGVNTVGLKLTATNLNVDLQGSKTGGAVVGGVVVTAGDGLTVTGSQTIKVNSTGTAGQADNVLDFTAADNQTVTLTGSQNTTIFAKAAIATTGFTINASAFTGKLTATGTAASDNITGGTGNDTLSGGTNAITDTFTGGAGNDKFNILAGITAATADIITDFATTVDTIGFGAAVLAANFSKAATTVADFTAALTAADLVLTNGAGVKQVNVQQVGSDSYVFYNDGAAAGADQVVKLAGVALTGIVAGDIVA